MRAFINAWTHGADWRTWVAHSTLATILSLPFAALGHLVDGARGMALAAVVAPSCYYLVRELEQLLYGWVDRNLDPDWRDHILDVVCPTVTVTVIWGWWLL